jgi:hypothetical protein
LGEADWSSGQLGLGHEVGSASDPASVARPVLVAYPASVGDAASVGEAAERLVGTIMGATDEDWSRGHDGQARVAVELIWLTVHAVTHQLDDLEMAIEAGAASG